VRHDGQAEAASAADLPDEQAAVFEAPAVLRVLWADPQHTAEHLALWSVKRFGPRASAAVLRLQHSSESASADELDRMVIDRQTRVAMGAGAFVGGPFIILIPVAFCAALLAQGQMALELAALAGHAPDDTMRAADLLVLQGAYKSTEGAAEALAKTTAASQVREEHRLPRGSRWSMIVRMAYLVGVLGAGEQKRSRLRAVLDWCLLGLTFVVGLVLPLVWVPYMAVSIRRSALRTGDRATRFYAQHSTVEAGVTITKKPTVQVAITGGLVRMIALILLPLVVAVIAFSTGVEVGTGRLLSAGILLIAISLVATIAWLAFQWRRHRRGRSAPVIS
jgi:hypothetical protein